MRHIYSDGSSLGNPRLPWLGFIFEMRDIKLYGYGGIVTNNQMELKAAIVAAKLYKRKNLVLYTQIQSM